MRNCKFYITYGLPASGKTTWAKKLIHENKDSVIHYKRVNKDDLREMLDCNVWNKENERFILFTRNNIINEAMKLGCNIISDDTNLAPKHISFLTQMVKDFNSDSTEFKYEIEVIDFSHVPKEECIRRDKLREKPVGEQVIRSMFNRFLKQKEKKQFLIPTDPSKPNCIICDLDGTLSWHIDRNIYDISRCGEDEVNQSILLLIKQMQSIAKIIFVTGREIKYFQQTNSFLCDKCCLSDYILYMREIRDCPDTEIKEKILKEKILPDYNVLFVLEDRERVVNMYRGNGIQCYQVKEGNY